jgi:hypothetical protein
MNDSPAYREIMDEGGVVTRREGILITLEERFGAQAAEQVRADVQTIGDLAQLGRLHRLAVRCPDLAAFREALRGEMPSRRSSRRKRSS